MKFEDQKGVSVVITVRNEGRTLASLLEGLAQQTLPPQEIIIVDAGSEDETPSVVARYRESGLPVKFLVKGGANRSEGRNFGVRAAKSEIIAVTDGGCVPDPQWLELITEPLREDESVDVGSGFYEAAPQNAFEEAVGLLSVARLEAVNPDSFLPSSRSVAFRRSAWERVGGYPEEEIYNEDTPFDLALKRAGCKFTFVPEAIVRWRPRSSLKAVVRQFFVYARGDAHWLLFFRHYWKYPLALLLIIASFFHWAFLLVLGVGVIGHLASKAWRCWRYAKRWKVVLWAPVVALAMDIGHVAGYLVGLLEWARFRARESER